MGAGKGVSSSGNYSGVLCRTRIGITHRFKTRGNETMYCGAKNSKAFKQAVTGLEAAVKHNERVSYLWNGACPRTSGSRACPALASLGSEQFDVVGMILHLGHEFFERIFHCHASKHGFEHFDLFAHRIFGTDFFLQCGPFIRVVKA